MRHKKSFFLGITQRKEGKSKTGKKPFKQQTPIYGYILRFVRQGNRMVPCVTVDKPAKGKPWISLSQTVTGIWSMHKTLGEAFAAMARLRSYQISE